MTQIKYFILIYPREEFGIVLKSLKYLNMSCY